MTKKNTQVSHNPHVSFLSDLASTSKGKSPKKYRKHTFNKITGVNVKPGFNLPTTVKEVFLESSIKIHPEAVAFLFYISGCSKNLLMYILSQKHDNLSGIYTFNASVVDEFQEFCLNHFGVKYTESTIKQAHRDLVSFNITLNVKTGSYFLNPLLSGGINTSGRRKLISEYTTLLIKKRKDPASDFYPKFKKISAKNKIQAVLKKVDLL